MLVLIKLIFLQYKTSVDCLDKLLFITVNFIRSEDNLALLHLFIDARTLWAHALNSEHAQNALCLFVDAHWLDWMCGCHTCHWSSWSSHLVLGLLHFLSTCSEFRACPECSLFICGCLLVGLHWALPLLCISASLWEEPILRLGVLKRTRSHIWLKLYLPIFLLRVGLVTLIIDSFLYGLGRAWSSLPIMLKLSGDVLCPVCWLCA